MTPLVAIHAFAALVALLLGAWQLFLSRKGTPVHRFCGRVWVVLMLFVAVSSFWIREIRHGEFSALHLLSIVTLVTVSMGVVAAIRGNLMLHRGNMVGSWIGLTIAGTFAAAIPARSLPTFVVTSPGGALLALLAVVAATIAVVAAGNAVAGRVPNRDRAGA